LGRKKHTRGKKRQDQRIMYLSMEKKGTMGYSRKMGRGGGRKPLAEELR